MVNSYCIGKFGALIIGSLINLDPTLKASPVIAGVSLKTYKFQSPSLKIISRRQEEPKIMPINLK